MIGIDIVDNAVKDSRSKTKFPVIKMNAHVTDFTESAFDVIVASHVVEHSPFPKVILREMKRICKHNGLIFIEIPIEPVMSAPGGGHFSHWPEKEEFRNLVLSEKVEIVKDYMGYSTVDGREVEGKGNHYIIIYRVIK